MELAARQTMWGGGAAPGPTPAYWGLCFTAEQANSTVAMVANGSAPSVSLLYSTDAANWSPFVVGTTTVTLASVGDKVWLKAGTGGNTTFSNGTASASWYHTFSLTGAVAASGSMMSLLNGEEETFSFDSDFAFVKMFSGCTSLTSAPELPATTLAKYCYYSLFQGCTSLTAAPELPATTLANGCYMNLFNGCTDLSSIRVGFTSFVRRTTNGWVNGVAATGTFYCPSALGTKETITRGVNACPEGWKVVNI